MIFLLALALAAGDATVPGVVNPNVTQANISSTICKSGWTKTVRPPVSYTNKLKFALMDKAGIPHSEAQNLELDHDIPIEGGGNPTDPNNLWIQWYTKKPSAHSKDKLENLIHKKICSGILSLVDGQSEFVNGWVESYRKYFGAEP